MARARTVVLVVVLLALGSWSATVGAQERSGAVRVAYPDEPVAWYPALEETTAAVDLAAVWGLPLYRIDDHGQLRSGLAAGARVEPGEPGGPWQVEIDLRPGTWTDGQPVVAEDVVATVGSLRETSHAPALEPLTSVEAVDDRTVRLTFDRPYGRWPYLLAGGHGVLPAHVLRDGGLEAYRDGVPVSGGPMRLESHEPGLRASFVAHPDSPLGAPGVERLEVYFTPSYETSLGLLRDHRVDAVIGHVALNPVERAHRVDGVRAAAPVGGTTAVVTWSPEGSGGSAEVREGARRAVDVSQLVEGLLGSSGAPLTSTIPTHPGPWERHRIGGAAGLDGVSLGILVPGHQEVPAFTGRVLQRDLRGGGAEVTLIRVEPEELTGPGARTADGELVLRRDLPRPSLTARVSTGIPPDARQPLSRADAAATNLDGAVDAAEATLFEHAYDLPLYRVGLSHAWRSELLGVRPSSWPGAAWWDVTAWRWDGEPPRQEPAMRGPVDAPS